MKKQMISLLVAVGLIFGVSQAFATNITIQDFAAGDGFGAPANGIGVGNEDNETEPGTVQGQVWDLEAFVVLGTTLHLIGGYNMQAGEAGSGGNVVTGMLVPGDLFIKVDTLATGQPGAAPLVNPPDGLISNSVYGYTHVVDLTHPVGATNLTADVIGVDSGSIFKSVVYDQFGGNPWMYDSEGTVVDSTGISYQAGLSSAQILANYGATVTGYGGNNLHNVLSIDLSFLSVPVGTDVWFSYTMECGNDSLKGKYSGGFYQVPDATTSALLIGLGLAAMSVFGFKRRKA